MTGGQDSLLDAMRACFLESGTKVVFRAEDPAVFEETYARLPYSPAMAAPLMLDYQLAYQRGFGGEWQDLSVTLYHDNKPCGLFIVSYARRDGVASLSSAGLPLMPPLFLGETPDVVQRRMAKIGLDVSGRIARLGSVGSFQSALSFCGESLPAFSFWYEQALLSGAVPALRHELYIDLSWDLAKIKSNFRKSYKALVHSGSRLWRVGIMARGDAATWQEFHDLHAQVAGRQTRCQESWDLQRDQIDHGEAFLTTLRDEAGTLVGGGFFTHSKDEGLYAVGAYDRRLFDKPLGHVVQYHAMEEMQKRGLRWYKIGARPYPQEEPAPTEKEVSIGLFKQGFATHLMPCYLLSHLVKAAP